MAVWVYRLRCGSKVYLFVFVCMCARCVCGSGSVLVCKMVLVCSGTHVRGLMCPDRTAVFTIVPYEFKNAG